MMRSGRIYGPAIWERPTGENESGLLPTPTVNGNYNRKGASKTSGDGLETAVRKTFPPPTARDSRTACPSELQRHQPNLETIVKLEGRVRFPTPQASDWKNKDCSRDYTLGNRKYIFPEDPANAVKMWPTPRAGNPGSRKNSKGGKILAEEVKKSVKFPTPTVQDYKHRGPNSSQQGLADVVRYPTPGTSGLSNGSGNCEAINKLYKEGKISEEERRSMRSGNGGQLNPQFVAWLMGYPLAWTDTRAEFALSLTKEPASSNV
jgi:hypothetical protein